MLSSAASLPFEAPPGSSLSPLCSQVPGWELFLPPSCLRASPHSVFSHLNIISKSPAQGVSQHLSALNQPAVYSTPRSGTEMSGDWFRHCTLQTLLRPR